MRFALLALLLIIAASLVSTSRMNGFQVKHHADTPTYRMAAESPFVLSDAISFFRPPIYPLMMRLARRVDPSYALLPYAQHALFGSAIVVLFLSGICAGLRPWEALVVSAPISQAAILQQYGALILGESVATAFAILAVAASLVIAAKGPSSLRNAALGLAVFLAVLTRPAFLFLVVFCPAAILLASPCFRRGLNRRSLFFEILPNVVAPALPLLAYATLRLAVIGHFGIVSFGGVTLAGFATNPEMLAESDVGRLRSDEMKILARRILERRREVAASGVSFLPAHPYVYDERAVRDSPQLKSWSDSYDPSIWNVAVPATLSHYRVSDAATFNRAWVKVNNSLAELSLALLREKPRLYVQWLALATGRAYRQVFHYETLGVVKGVVPGSVFPLAMMFWALLICIRTFVGVSRNRPQIAAHGFQIATGYASMALLYFALGVLLVVMVEQPLRRYVIALSVLMPGAVLLLAIRVMLHSARVLVFHAARRFP